MKRASAGMMRTRVVIQRLAQSLTLTGGGHLPETTESSWETYITRWARLTSLAGRESLVGDQQNAYATAELEMYSDSKTRAITAGMRAKIGSVTYGIAEPPYDIDGRNERVRVRLVDMK